jgi:glycerol uptake facilitator-like aquaporin
MTVRKKIAMLVAEFMGTAVLATVVMAVAKANIGIPYFVSIAAGVTLAGLVLGLGVISGGHFNPAVTVGLWTTRKVPTLQAIAYIAVQMLGAVAAWKLFNYLNVSILEQGVYGSSGAPVKLHAVAEATKVDFLWTTFWGEAVGAFVFMFGIAAAVFQKQEGGKAASLIGISLMLGVLVATLGSAGVLNPAIALTSDNFSRAYIFGPLLGSVVAFNLYYLLFSEDKKSVAYVEAAAKVVTKTKTTTTKKKK